MTETSTSPAEPRAFASTLLRAGTRAIAAHAVETLLANHPESADLFGGRAFRQWQDNIAQRIEELAAAVHVGSPEVFIRDVSWSIAAFAAREVPVESVAHSLEALGIACRVDLPENCMEVIQPVLDAGIEAARAEPLYIHRLNPTGPLGKLALDFLENILQGRRHAGIGLLVDAFDAGTPLASLYEQVLLPVEAEIGTMWHLGEVSIPEEHAATEATRGAMAVLAYRAHVSDAPARTPLNVLATAVEGDNHDIGVRAVADLAEVAGFTSVALGADVPVRDIVRACDTFDAHALVLSATMTVHLPSVGRAIAAVRTERPAIRVIVGGQGFARDPAVATTIGADAFASTPSHAIELINPEHR